MKRYLSAIFVISAMSLSMSAQAAEKITYAYDAKGRLVKVVHTGTVNNNVQTTYNHDKSDNRTNVKTIGSNSNVQ